MSTVLPDVRQAAIDESGYAHKVRLWQPHNPAFWLYWWMLINGAFVYLSELADFRVSGQSLTLAIGLEILYTLPFVWFITRRDRYEREPAKLAALAFLWGGLVSTFLMAASANTAVLNIYAKTISVDFATSWGPAFTAPFTEETAKLTGILIVVLLARQHVRSMYDGILLGMFVGLGFQVFENVQYLLNTAQANFNSNPFLDIFFVFGARSVTGVGGHWLFTGLCGAGVGYYLAETQRSKAARLLGASGFIAVAMLAHGLFDAGGALGSIAMPMGATILVISIVVAWKLAGRRARSWMRVLLADEVARGTLSEEELEVLAGPHKARETYLKALKKSEGKQAAKRVGWVLDSLTELAGSIAATNDPASSDAEVARSEVRRVRSIA